MQSLFNHCQRKNLIPSVAKITEISNLTSGTSHAITTLNSFINVNVISDIKSYACLPTAFPQYFLLQAQNHRETHIQASIFSEILCIHSQRGEEKKQISKTFTQQANCITVRLKNTSQILGCNADSYLERNGGKPETIWYIIHPRAQRSELRDADFSVRSSGETYCAVPTKLFLLRRCSPSSSPIK